jgi:hypothetical protein
LKKTPGTLAFLLRWHFAQFAGGLAILAFGAYKLMTYKERPPSALDAVASAPIADLFLPAMWLAVVMGLAMIGRAYLKARSDAGK